MFQTLTPWIHLLNQSCGFHIIFGSYVSSNISLLGLQIAKLEGVIQALEREREDERKRVKERETAEMERRSTCCPDCVPLREELENATSSMQQIQVVKHAYSTHASIRHPFRSPQRSITHTQAHMQSRDALMAAQRSAVLSRSVLPGADEMKWRTLNRDINIHLATHPHLL